MAVAWGAHGQARTRPEAHDERGRPREPSDEEKRQEQEENGADREPTQGRRPPAENEP